MPRASETTIHWEPYEAEILSRYVGQNNTLDETMAHMESTHGLNASLRQYKARFSGYKNLKSYEWVSVVEVVQERAARGIESEVCLYGRPIDRKRLKREIRRYGSQARRKESRKAVIGRTARDRISIRTPRQRSPSPSLFPHTSVQIDATMSFENLLTGLDFANDTNMNAGNNSQGLDMLEPNAIPLLDVFRPLDESICNAISTETSTRNVGDITISSSVGHFDLSEISLTDNCNWEFTIDLPWFQLLLHSDLHFVSYKPSATTNNDLQDQIPFELWNHDEHDDDTDRAIKERGNFLGSLLGYSPNNQVSCTTTDLTSHIAAQVPERFEGELGMKVQQAIESASKRPLHLFELIAFFASNNKLTTRQINNFLKWVLDQKYTHQLDSFLRLNIATTRVFSRKIMSAAVAARNISVLRPLILSGVDFQHIIYEAIQIENHEFIELLLSRLNPEQLQGNSGGLLLLHISGTDNVRAAEILAREGANINFKGEIHNFMRTPLYYAVEGRNLNMVRFLLKEGADANIEMGGGSDYPTAIAAAVWFEPDLEIVTLLLEYGANIHCSIYNQDLLDYLSLEDPKVYRFLLKKATIAQRSITTGDILDAASNGSNAFSRYLSRHQGKISQDHLEKALYESINRIPYGLDVTACLLDQGVDANGPTLDEPPILLTASFADFEEGPLWAQLLIDAGADVNVPELFSRAIEARNFDVFCLILENGADLDTFGPQALVAAAKEGMIEAVAVLLDSGVPINVVGGNETPAQAAAAHQTLDMIEYLLERGADLNAPAYRYNGRTALQRACYLGRYDMAKYLLANGADVNAVPAASGGFTALEAIFQSSYSGYDNTTRLFELLLNNGADLTSPYNKQSIIHSMVKKNLRNMLETALNVGVDPNVMSRGKEGRTPIQLAAEQGNLELTQLLVAHGARINSNPAYQHGRTALQAAASRLEPNMELLRFFVDNGANVNASAGVFGGITALQGAAIAGNIPVAQYLLDKGADVNARPAIKKGRTCIEGAAEHGRLDMVQLLLNCGANVGLRGEGLGKAVKLAEKNGHSEIVALLNSHSPS